MTPHLVWVWALLVMFGFSLGSNFKRTQQLIFFEVLPYVALAACTHFAHSSEPCFWRHLLFFSQVKIFRFYTQLN